MSQKPCPACGNDIVASSRCKYCGADWPFGKIETLTIKGLSALSTVFLVLTAFLLIGEALGRTDDVSTPAPAVDAAATPVIVSDSIKRALFYARLAKDNVLQKLRDPESAKFGVVSVHNGQKGSAEWLSGVVVCGTVNSRNGFGGMAGHIKFIWSSATGELFHEEDSMAYPVAVYWPTLCVGTPIVFLPDDQSMNRSRRMLQ